MVRIELYRRPDGALTGFQARGHTGFAERGSDVLCAAVSALTTVTVLGLQARLGLEPDVQVDDEQGYLRCHLRAEQVPADLRLRVQDLLETMALGLHEIAKDYPNYIRVKEVTR